MISKVELSAEIARIALDCPSCSGPALEAIQRYRGKNKQNNNNNGIGPVRGRSSLPAMNESKDGLTNVHYTSKYK